MYKLTPTKKDEKDIYCSYLPLFAFPSLLFILLSLLIRKKILNECF